MKTGVKSKIKNHKYNWKVNKAILKKLHRLLFRTNIVVCESIWKSSVVDVAMHYVLIIFSCRRYVETLQYDRATTCLRYSTSMAHRHGQHYMVSSLPIR